MGNVCKPDVPEALDQRALDRGTGAAEPDWPVLICVLGDFRVLTWGRPLEIRSGGKAEALLLELALRPTTGHTREALLSALWPDHDAVLAGESLNSLIYRLHRLLGEVLGGASPVLWTNGRYALNLQAGVNVDLALMDQLAQQADELHRSGDLLAAMATYDRAVRLYRGDLCAGPDVYAAMERERLRDRYSNLLARQAEHHFSARDYASCLAHALPLLAHDPCREDVHRLVIRCYVRQGERARALRQYRLCESILRMEFDAPLEPATVQLFEQVRLDPGSV